MVVISLSGQLVVVCIYLLVDTKISTVESYGSLWFELRDTIQTLFTLNPMCLNSSSIRCYLFLSSIRLRLSIRNLTRSGTVCTSGPMCAPPSWSESLFRLTQLFADRSNGAYMCMIGCSVVGLSWGIEMDGHKLGLSINHYINLPSNHHHTHYIHTEDPLSIPCKDPLLH